MTESARNGKQRVVLPRKGRRSTSFTRAEVEVACALLPCPPYPPAKAAKVEELVQSPEFRSLYAKLAKMQRSLREDITEAKAHAARSQRWWERAREDREKATGTDN